MKRAIVEYDELGNPVKLMDVREFRDDSVEPFKALCAGNAKKRDDRLRQAEQKALQKENEAKLRHNAQSAWISRLWLENALANGTVTMTEEQYEAFETAFGTGWGIDPTAMPEEFLVPYNALKED